MNKHETHKIIHVVDDEDALREVLLQILSCYGFRVKTFDSGENYLAHMQNDSFDTPAVLLSDINMSGMNGFQLLREVQRRHPAVCCMLMTADPDQCTDQHLQQHALAGRVSHVFTKPIHPLNLKNILENA
ncbi:MAG: response regulator [Mariprofundaceae bacterium]|nr:response regulator [Mariprofundaceae bacterium]